MYLTFPQIDALPDIVKEVDGKCEVFLDGGVTVGSDIFKAVALGAKMVRLDTTSFAKFSQTIHTIFSYNMIHVLFKYSRSSPAARFSGVYLWRVDVGSERSWRFTRMNWI